MDLQPPSALDAWLRLTPDQRAEAERWFQILERKISPEFNPDIPSKQLGQEASEDEATICRKLGQWKKGVYDKEGKQIAPPGCKAALAPRQPGPPRGRSLVSDEMRGEILDRAADIIRNRGRAKPLPAQAVHRFFIAREEVEGDKAPGFAQVRSILRSVPRQTLLAWAGGIEELKKHGGLPRLTVPPPPHPNLEWYLDQWVADVTVMYEDGAEGRPVIVSPVDRFGGGPVMGLAIHRRLTGHTVTEALIDAMLRKPGIDPCLAGRPQILRMDLGRENRTTRLRAGCEALGIQLLRTTPKDPAVKGIQERLHGEYRRFCSERLPGYAPSDIKTKPLRDRPLLRFEEFCERFRTFVFGEFNVAPYHGQYGQRGKSRLDLRREAAFTPVISDEAELRVLFAEAKLVTVWPQGIKLHGLMYTHPALGGRIGQKVWARQGRTDTEVIVHDEEKHLVCVARNALAESAQLDDEGRRQFTTDRRALAKALVIQADEQIGRARNKPDWLLRRAEKRMAEQGAQPPRPGIRQVNPATGQTPAVASAQAGGRLKRYRYQR